VAEARPRAASAQPPFVGPTGRPGPGPAPLGAAPVRRAKDARGTARRLGGYLRVRGLPMAVIAALVLATTAATVATPYFLGVAVDRYIIPGDHRGLLALAAALAAMYLVSSLALWVQSWVMAALAQDTVTDMRRDLFHRLLQLPVRFFDTHTRGELMSRLSNDVETVNVTLNQGFILVISSLLTLSGNLVMMLVLSPALTLLSLVTVPPMLLLTRRVSRGARESFREQQESLGALNGHVEETISGRRAVQAYGREAKALEAFDLHNGRLRAAGTRALILSGNMGPYMNLLNNVCFALVAAGGGYLALRGLATAGLIASFVSYARQFGRPLNELATQWSQIQSAMAGAERVFEIMDEPPEPPEAPDARPLGAVAGGVRFSGVRFGYDPAVPVLADLTLEAAPGSTVALVGPTGAGKTTIVNLLTRFYDVEAGAISIDGRDIRTATRDSLRSSLGIVLQDTHLFSETVRENIRYGRLSAADAEVEEAARTANAEPFILRLPRGYDTVLTEEGGNLSQGQRQLLAIARAILADPAILILDEATSSVDTRTELHIQQAMLRLMRGRTSFVIAHRLSTIRDADEILVMNGGRIVERGTHEELLAARGFYHGLHAAQRGRSTGR
jgi:ATP-binding cassette, subfamily B, multidrug efflux pump